MPPNGALGEEEEGDACEELEVEETEGELDTGETKVEERTPAVGVMDGT